MRKRIDAVAYELFDIAESLEPSLPTLAAIYLSLGKAIEGSHFRRREFGGHTFFIDMPEHCRLITGPAMNKADEPSHVEIVVPHTPAA